VRLEKWQRNSIYEAIQGAGLDPGEFECRNDDTESQLTHRWSESYLILGGNPGHYVGRSVIGEAAARPYEAYSWHALEERVSGWLADVNRDLETPDLWAELRREQETLGVAPEENANTTFTADEQAEIATLLREIKERVKDRYPLSDKETLVLSANLDYLEAAAGRVGRIDWRAMFVGILVSFLLSVALPPESVRHTLIPLLRGLGHLYGLPELPGG
jgi:hypothetical protein